MYFVIEKNVKVDQKVKNYLQTSYVPRSKNPEKLVTCD